LKTALFTKLFQGHTVDAISRHAIELGFDAIDLLVRNGFQVAPEEPDSIFPAVAVLEEAGLSVPMATTDLTDPAWHGAERLLWSCAQSGIGLVRLGYWAYDYSAGYASQLESARRDLHGLAGLAEATGIRLALQLHGDTLHGSGAQAIALLQEHDPRFLSAYPDPGNQVVQDGREDWRFTFDVLRPWLSCVGVKNGGWFASNIDSSGQRRWWADWLGVADGMVPWDEILDFLAQDEFDGILSFHSHYEAPFDQVLEQTRADLRYVERLLGSSPIATVEDSAVAELTVKGGSSP